jgi:type I restriction enzyme, S subunit
MASFGTLTIEEATERLIDYRGKTPPKSASGVRLVTAKVVKGGQIHDEPAEFIATDFYDEWMRRGLPQKLDVLLTTEAPLGEVAILRDEARVALAQRIILLRAKPGLLDPVYLFYALQSDFGQGELKARASGTTVLGIKQSELRKVRVPVFPLPIQRRIAGILSAYDELIENSQRRINILESMARALYREWFVHFRFPGHESVPRVPSPLGEIPQGWEVRKLGDLCELRKDPYRDSDHSALPLLDMARMPSRSLAPSDTGSPAELTTSRILFQAGDTLFGAIRCYLHKVVAAHCPGVTNTSVLVLRPRSPSFRALVAIIASDIDTIRWAETQSTGTKMPVINWGVFQGMPSPIPSKAVAQAFEDIAGPMLDEIGVLATQIQTLRRTRDLLLPRLLSGQIDVEAMPT